MLVSPVGVKVPAGWIRREDFGSLGSLASYARAPRTQSCARPTSSIVLRRLKEEIEVSVCLSAKRNPPVMSKSIIVHVIINKTSGRDRKRDDFMRRSRLFISFGFTLFLLPFVAADGADSSPSEKMPPKSLIKDYVKKNIDPSAGIYNQGKQGSVYRAGYKW